MKKNKVLTYIVSFLVFTLLIVADQITKVLSVQHLKGQPPVDIIKDVLQLTYVQNTGAAWGMMAGGTVFFAIGRTVSIAYLQIVKTPLLF